MRATLREPRLRSAPLAPPDPSRSWDAAPYADARPPTFNPESLVEVDREYGLPDLIDLALRTNPETRIAWAQARAAAARAGLADSAYFPVLVVAARGGYLCDEDLAKTGPVSISGPSLTPVLALEWKLIDFGRREADFDSASQQLLQSNFQFNRNLQQVAYAVQQSFYAYDASRAQVEAALANLKSATSVLEAARVRLEHGLATQTELLLARQDHARAEYELQAAQRLVADTQARLADALGISPAVPLRLVALADLPLPSALRESVEETMDRALAQRPDLFARLAQLRARDAEVRRARADFLPALGLTGRAGGTGASTRPRASRTPTTTVDSRAELLRAAAELAFVVGDSTPSAR